MGGRHPKTPLKTDPTLTLRLRTIEECTGIEEARVEVRLALGLKVSMAVNSS